MDLNTEIKDKYGRTRYRILILVLLVSFTRVKGVFYPKTYNVAAGKPVHIWPPNSTCDDSQYCFSSTDPGSSKFCDLKNCKQTCVHSHLPVGKDNILQTLVTGWGDCIIRDHMVRKYKLWSARFKGTKGAGSSSSCHLNIETSSLTSIILMGNSMDISLTFWIRPELTSHNKTIFQISNLAGENLFTIKLQPLGYILLETGGRDYSSPSWQVPNSQWTHVGLQAHGTFFAVFLNGNFISPALFNIQYSSVSKAGLFRLGETYQETDRFIGRLEDVKIYFNSLSNREILEVYNGSFPETRIQTECRCPPSHPALSLEDPAYCVANKGQGRYEDQRLRVNTQAHPEQFINDNKTSSVWISSTGIAESRITIDLLDIYQVLEVEVQFYSPMPEQMIIERRLDSSSPWRAWKYYSQNCSIHFNQPPNRMLSGPQDVNCQPMFQGDVPYSDGRKKFNLLSDRPGQIDNNFSEDLQVFLRAGQVRLTLKGHPHVTDDRHKYHALAEFWIKARCDCNGNAEACNLITGTDKYSCSCISGSKTEGRACDSCVSGAFRNVTDEYHYDSCSDCDCYQGGIRYQANNCSELGGQCPCKLYAAGRRCDTCRKGFYNLSSTNLDGCTPCTCSMEGVANGVLDCDPITAKCNCKENVEGFECDRCKPNTFKMDRSNPEGCSSCDCDPAGVQSRIMSCHDVTGQCSCKTLVAGRRCDECIDGNYNLQTSEPLGCTPCNCDYQGSLNSSCDPLSGQCFCQMNVTGRTCNRCITGYYAGSASKMNKEGCTLPCDCNLMGSVNMGKGGCDLLSGQCQCKENVKGRKCDQCKDGTYKMEMDNILGCTYCKCNTGGTVNGTGTCDLLTGKCICKDHIEGDQCTQCSDGYYGLSGQFSDDCYPCECHPDGSKVNSTCNSVTGQCECRNEGNVTMAGTKCTPYVHTTIPRYGPVSGGTIVTMHGGYLRTMVEGGYINIGRMLNNVSPLKCRLRKDQCTDHTVVCITESAKARGRAMMDNVLDQQHNINMYLPDGATVVVSKFEYRPDPVITNIAPMSTFLKGGKALTVTGDHFTSVFAPYLEVTMSYNGTMEVFSSICKVNGSKTMSCPTPEIHIPSGLLMRKRRDIASVRTQIALQRSLRIRRDADDKLDVGIIEKKINNDSLNFYLGFRLDGVEEYRNLSLTMPEFSVLNVYPDPEIYPFEEEDDVRMYKPYWPHNHNHVLIKGARLNYAAKPIDYQVKIGKEVCHVMDLATNQIACQPPDREPESESEVLEKDGAPLVTVSVGRIKQVIGYLKYEHNLWDNLAFRYGIIAAIAVLVILIFVLVLVCLLRRRKKEKGKHPHLELHTSSHANAYISAYYAGSTGASTYLSPVMDILEILPTELKLKVQDCLIDSKRMVVGKIIGKGQFGRVHIGRLVDDGKNTQGRAVAIKTIRENNVTLKDVELFLEEATIMKDFEHSNILHLVGVAIENNRAFVILPFMSNGDLKSFIQNEENLLTVGELIHFSLQISDGMSYLSDQKCVHRDLAARNCMVDKDLIVKVADFGLSRDIYQTDYYQQGDSKCPMPIKWLSLESLEKGLYSTKSDVWSFGVVLWELLTRGCSPFPDVDPFDVKDYLKVGHRMDKPDFAPPEMYVLMLNCWDSDPQMRPSFKELFEKLSRFLEGQNSTTQSRSKYVRPRSLAEIPE